MDTRADEIRINTDHFDNQGGISIEGVTLAEDANQSGWQQVFGNALQKAGGTRRVNCTSNAEPSGWRQTLGKALQTWQRDRQIRTARNARQTKWQPELGKAQEDG